MARWVGRKQLPRAALYDLRTWVTNLSAAAVTPGVCRQPQYHSGHGWETFLEILVPVIR
jgi:hypothetical protein